MGTDHQGRRSRGRVRNVAPLPPCLKHRASTRRFDWGESARGAGELPDGAGGDDGAVFRVGLVVLLGVAEVVEIVDHQATGLAAAAQRLLGLSGEKYELVHSDGVSREIATIRAHEARRAATSVASSARDLTLARG